MWNFFVQARAGLTLGTCLNILPRRLHNDIDMNWSNSSQPHSEFSDGVFYFNRPHLSTRWSQSIIQTGSYETMTSHSFRRVSGGRCPSRSLAAPGTSQLIHDEISPG
jgi:hypothetical protein